MIQKTSQRQLNAVFATPTRGQFGELEEWGQWIRNKHYSLEVTQHPIRARMCGFGDKDRRPLAPAAVAKMIVRQEDSSIIEVDDIDVDFFIVTVDLWSADGTQEMNLVLHPSSADRYVPPAKPRKKTSSSITPRPSLSSPYPTPHDRSFPPTNHTPSPGSDFTLRPIDSTPSGTTPLLTPASATPYATSAYPFPPPDPFSGGLDSTNPWSYPPPLDRTSFQPAPTLPSIHSINRNSPAANLFEPTSATFPTPEATDLTTPLRGWNDGPAGLFDTHSVDSVFRDSGVSRWSNDPLMLPGTDAWPLPVPNFTTQHAFQPFGQTSVSPSRAPPPQKQEPEEQQTFPRDGQHTIPPLPRHTYTRTLVGPLSANAQRLQDEHRKPGIFFLFQDLSIRTEGTFRLRMRLMNVGVSPAPNGLSNSVHTGVSPVLAQVFTEPFTVFSAKRFPGVPDTTALSIAFGNQGQKLPLRNRNGIGKSRRTRRPDTVSSDEDSS